MLLTTDKLWFFKKSSKASDLLSINWNIIRIFLHTVIPNAIKTNICKWEGSSIKMTQHQRQREAKCVRCHLFCTILSNSRSSMIICFHIYVHFYVSSCDSPGIKYNVSIAERRFNPRAVLDNLSKVTPQNLTLLPGEETCEHIFFHVMVRSTNINYFSVFVH